MSDINMFGEPGFQVKSEKYDITPTEELTVTEEAEVPPKKSRIGEEILAVFFAIVVIVLIVWYVGVRTKVETQIEEYSPHQYHLKIEKENPLDGI